MKLKRILALLCLAAFMTFAAGCSIFGEDATETATEKGYVELS